MFCLPNIIQCIVNSNTYNCSLDGNAQVFSVSFSFIDTKTLTVDCISSIEGLFQFSYEVMESGGGICNNSESTLEACQIPGSPNYDNKDLRMHYKACKDIGKDQFIRFKCMGTWNAQVGRNQYTFVALAHDETGNTQEQYKCLMTLRDQHSEDNSIRWGLSRFGDCRQLKSLEQSPVRIVLRRKAPSTQYMIPRCMLPRNMTGTWFTQGKQFASEVFINYTHIYYKTQKSQFDFEETWFSCQEVYGTRYLMTKEVVGRCEVNFVCYDLMPRHQGLIRYRVGRPMSLPYKVGSKYGDLDFLTKSFRQTCSWQWLTFKRNNADWKYEVLIQDPPTPVTCPIGGRYYFTQDSDDKLQLYDTRIRGITDRPRVRINCLNSVSEFKACDADPTRIEVDNQYCETLDYRGRPIGEYEEADHILTCVGFWLEDMKSYMITFDEEDAISKYRCWVYERTSWTSIALSRAETARCPKNQTARSYQIDGALFRMEVMERERLFDDCPQRFDSGIDVGLKPLTVFSMYTGCASCVTSKLNILFLISMSLICWLLSQ